MASVGLRGNLRCLRGSGARSVPTVRKEHNRPANQVSWSRHLPSKNRAAGYRTAAVRWNTKRVRQPIELAPEQRYGIFRAREVSRQGQNRREQKAKHSGNYGESRSAPGISLEETAKHLQTCRCETQSERGRG